MPSANMLERLVSPGLVIIILSANTGLSIRCKDSVNLGLDVRAIVLDVLANPLL